MNPDLFASPPPNLPLLASGETLYSWSGHVHLWNGNSLAVTTSRQLFGVNHAALLHDFPSHVGALADRTQGLLGDASTIALRHTLLGYFLAFLPPAIALQLLNRTILGAVPHLKFCLGITSSRGGGHHPLKGCEECFRADELTTGYAPWKLADQFPSSAVCRVHMRPLVIAQCLDTLVHRREWLLPRSGPPRIWSEIPVRKDSDIEKLCKLSEFSEQVAALSPGALDQQTLAQTYQLAFAGQGLLTEAGTPHLERLVKLVRKHYSGLERIPGFHVLDAIRKDWPGLAGALDRKPSGAGHPIKHLLLMAMFFDEWADFMTQYQRAMEASPVEEKSPKPVTPYQLDPRCDEFIRLVKHENMSITAAATQIGVSTNTGLRWAKIAGIAFTPRAKTLDSRVLNKVRKLLRSGKSKQVIIRQTGISSPSLNRLISSEPELGAAWREVRHARDRQEYRARFCNVIERNPGIPVKGIRKIPGNSYTWLYHNDREWLIRHLPGLWQ